MMNIYWKNNQAKKIVIITLFLIVITNINIITFATNETSTRTRIQSTKAIGENNLQEMRLERKNKRLEELENAKQSFETKKEEILNELKSGNITRKEAHEQIIEEKEKIIDSSKRKLDEEKEKLKSDNLSRLRTIIRKKLNAKLVGLKSLSRDKKEAVFEKLIEKLDIELNKSDISNNNKIIITIMKDIITNKKNRLNGTELPPKK